MLRSEKKNASKVKNTLLQWILKNILENLMFQRTARFIMVDSCKINFMKGIVIVVNVDEKDNIWNLQATVYWSRDGDGIAWSKFTTPLLY